MQLPRIVIAGNGQLGQMLQQAGAPLQLEVQPIHPIGDQLVELNDDDVISVEIEHWPENPVGNQLKEESDSSIDASTLFKFTQGAEGTFRRSNVDF